MLLPETILESFEVRYVSQEAWAWDCHLQPITRLVAYKVFISAPPNSHALEQWQAILDLNDG